MAPKKRGKRSDRPSNKKGNNGGSYSSGEKNTFGDAHTISQGNDGASSSSRIMNTLVDARTYSQFLEILTTQTEEMKQKSDGNSQVSLVFLECFKKLCTLPETIDALKSLDMDSNQTSIVYYGLLNQMSSSVKEEYEKLCLDAVHERNAQEDHENQQVPENMKAFMTDIQKTIKNIVASAATDIQREMNAAITQLKENIYSKINEDNQRMSTQIHKLQELLRSDLGSCKTMIQQKKTADSAQLASVLSSAQSLTCDLAAESQKNRSAKNLAAEHSSQLASVLSTARSLTRELAESQKNLPAKNLEGLLKLLEEEKYEESFSWALDSNDASTISWLCSQVDFSQLPLSQAVLRKLLKELASDLKKDTSRKLDWIADVIKVIKCDFTSAQEARPIFELVNQRLRHYASTNLLEKGAIAGLLASLPL